MPEFNERLKAYNNAINNIREMAKSVCLAELAKTLPDRQKQAEKAYKANYPEWLKEMGK